MRLRQAVAGGGDTEVAIMRVAAQAVGFEILLAIVADGDTLLRTTRRLGCRKPARGRAIFALRPWALIAFRDADFAAVLRVALLRGGDFFCAAVRAAARDVGFCLAIDVLPFRSMRKG